MVLVNLEVTYFMFTTVFVHSKQSCDGYYCNMTGSRLIQDIKLWACLRIIVYIGYTSEGLSRLG